MTHQRDTTIEQILAWRDQRTTTAKAFEDQTREWCAKNQRAFTAAKSNDTLEVVMFDVIGEDWWTGGGITAKTVKAKLDASKDAKTIKVLLNSPGGDAFEGLAIHSLLRASGARIEIEVMGLAASAATVIAMAGDSLSMHEGAMFMIHQAWTVSVGSASDMTAIATFLNKVDESATSVYASRTGLTREEIASMLAATTWMTAQEAVASKFVDAVVPARAMPKASAGAKALQGMMLGSGVRSALTPGARWMGGAAAASSAPPKAHVPNRLPANESERQLLVDFRHLAAQALGIPWPTARSMQTRLLRGYLGGDRVRDSGAKERAERCRAQLAELGIDPLDS